MPYPMHILVNDFAIRSFRETADKDYIAARMAYRARLIQPFLWSALHCLEKYVKCILVLNRIDSKGLGHNALPGIERMKKRGKFEVELTEETVKFIKHLEDFGAEYRYYEVSYSIQPFEIIRFDRAVWEIRRYCQPLDYEIVDLHGKKVNLLTHNLSKIRREKDKDRKGSSMLSETLETIIGKKDHPAREPLIWNNLFFGTSRRKSVRMRSHWESGNSPFFMHPEAIDEVVKYAYVPKGIADGVRIYAKQKAAEEAKAARAAKKAAKLAAKAAPPSP